jgi:hypothetical protein
MATFTSRDCANGDASRLVAVCPKLGLPPLQASLRELWQLLVYTR